MSCDYIQNLASGIWEDINQPSSISIQYISGWLVSPFNIGKLNNVLNACYSGVSGCISPELKEDEMSIYKDIYLSSYYGKKALESLMSASADSWLQIRDSDGSSVSRQNKNEISKTFVALKTQIDQDLKDKIFAYRQNRIEVSVVEMGSGSEIVMTDYVNNRNPREYGRFY